MRRSSILAVAIVAAGCGAPQLDHADRATEALQQCQGSDVVEGIDVYDGNGTIDWPSVKSSGIGFAYIKATQGTGNTQSGFATNWAGARSAGVMRGAYHFFDPTEDGVEQAQHFLSVVGTLQPDDLPPMLDVECPDGDSQCLGYAGGSGDAPTADIHARMVDFLNTVEGATGRRAVIYTFESYFSSNGIPDSDLASYPLWVASINSGSTCFNVPADWSSVTIWQYDWNGVVGGISGAVDRDRFLGTTAQLQAFANGTPFKLHRSITADLDGDGRADACGRGADGIHCLLAADSGFGAPFQGPALDDATGWSDPKYASTIQFGDLDGDGRSDLCARGADGMTCWLSTGNGFGPAITGPAWSDAAGWGDAKYASTIQLADVDGDGHADLCARSNTGLVCYLFQDGGFGSEVVGPSISDSADWGSPQYYSTLRMVDIDGDHKADLCGRAKAGIVCWRSLGTAFDTTILSGPAWSDTNGWDSPAYYATIQFADVNGDGKTDVCGRGPNGVECWLSDGSGFPMQIAGPSWSDASGWAELAYESTVQFADIDGDHKADVCGRGASGVTCYLSDGNGFPTRVDGPTLSDSSGWNALPYFWTIQLADVTGDGKADLCARAADGYRCWPSLGNGFGAPFGTSSFSDADGFDSSSEFPTVTLVGGAPARTSGSSGSSGSSGTSGSTGDGSSGSNATSGTGSAGATGSTGTVHTEPGGCGCGSHGAPDATMLAFALMMVIRRRKPAQ